MASTRLPVKSAPATLQALALAAGLASLACLAAPQPAQAFWSNGFEDPYAPSDWTASPTVGAGSSITADTLTLNANSASQTFSYITTAAAPGPVLFDYSTTTTNSPLSPVFGYSINGNQFQLVAFDQPSASGSFSFFVNQGDTFGFYATSGGSTFGTLAITNFRAPVPAPLPALGVAAALGASRRLRRLSRQLRPVGPLSSATH